MVTVRRTEEFLAHKGVKGMKWGYNDGQRNGRRTASELKKLGKTYDKLQKEGDETTKNSGDIETDYHEANNMLKYLGITLDLQSDDEKAAETIAIYNTMKNTKDNYESQHEWLKAFSKKLAAAGYDMDAVDKMLDENKDALNKMNTGTGTGNTEKSNQDWKENDMKSSKKKKSKKKEETSESESDSKSDTDSDSEAKKTTKKKSKSKSKSNSSSTGGSSTSSKSTTSKTTTSKTTSSKSTSSKSTSSKSTSSKSTSSKSTTSKTKPKSTTKSYYDAVNDMKKAKARRINDPIQRAKAMSKLNHSENQNGVELYHHGILGQRWGVRRYQNLDGSLTSEGRKRYGYKTERETVKKVGKVAATVGATVGTAAAISATKSDAQKAIRRNSTVAKLTGNEPANISAKDVNKTVGAAKSSARVANKYLDKYEEAKYKKKLSEMSDEELEKEIEKALPEYRAKELRRQLEARYTTVVGNPDSTKEGREKVMKALEIVGDLAVVVAAGKVILNK